MSSAVRTWIETQVPPASQSKHPASPVSIDHARAASEAAEVEEYCVLAGECAIHQPKFTRKDELRKLILARYPNLANDATEIAIGLTMNGLVTECDQKREVTPQGKRKLFHQWKATEFFRRCEVALKQLPDPKDPLNLYSVQDKSGPRHVKPVAKPQLQAAA